MKITFDGIKIKVFETGGTPRIRTSRSAGGRAMSEIHTHFTYEIFFVTQGTLTLVTDNAAEKYENAVVIIPPQLRHYGVPDSEGSYCLLFSAEAPIARIKDGITVLPMSEEIAFYISHLAEKDEREYELLTALIFSELSGEQTASVKPTTHINEIDKYINSHLDKKITLTDISYSVHLSTKQVSRIIKKEYGMSFTELITDKRLAKAEILLKNTDMKISEIAQNTFCGNESYFYTLFKKTYGITPLKYKKRHR